MRERPILMNGSMVRAILAGAKTQTRRLVKPHPPSGHNFAGFTTHSTCRADEGKAVWGAGDVRTALIGAHRVACPFGQPGDRLWVRESFADLRGTGIEHRPDPAGPIQRYAYSADTLAGSDGDHARKAYGIKWRPSIHMPRAACRLVLEITDVRFERLQDISEADALAEGIERLNGRFTFNGGAHESLTARSSFMTLWDSTGGMWVENPWVWVIEFKRVEVAGG